MASYIGSLVLWLFTIGYILQHVGTVLMIKRILRQKSIYGVSVDTQLCFLIATFARVVWSFDTRLAGMPLTYLDLAVSIGLLSYTVYLCFRMKDMLYNDPPFYVRTPVLVGVTAVLSMAFHPGERGDYFFTV